MTAYARRRHAAPAILSLLAVLFLASAGTRMVEGLGAALARESAPEAPGEAVASGAEEAAFIVALNQRAARLDEREEALADRMQALALAEARARERTAELRAAEEALAATLALADQAAERDLVQLTSLYEAMRPKDAALLFEEMDPNFAAGFIARMQTDAAAAILAGLTPRAAYAISAVLAGRHVGVPQD